MKRIPLPVGAQIQSDSLCFSIDSVLGHGANCIVYNAHYDDGFKHHKEVIIKECYPVRASVSRQEHSLSWDSIDEMQSAFDRMQRSYDLASEMQDSDVTRSASVYILDKVSANGTQYIIMIPQHGHSYDKDNSTDIADIIRTVLALCNAVGLYHQAGYLHLDIKPSNFIAATDHTGKGKNIALFDLDTLVALDDIQSASVAGVSYTKEWAAPEQKQMQIAKLCRATDLYAIGAVLFERIMNRMPTNADLSPFASWEFDDRFSAKRVNPKAKRLLTDIFHKTLAANVKRRYQTAEDLSTAMEELLSVVCSKAPYVATVLPPNTVKVIGRDEDLQSIHKAFVCGKRAVFLHGEGGIGKSTLAISYGNAYSYCYDAVLFLRYKDSLKSLLYEVFLYNYNTEKDEDKNKDKDRLPDIKQALSKNVLLIIDNFDVSVDQDDYLSEILRLKTNIIFTTRTDFSDVLDGDIKQIEINTLENNELFSIFSQYGDISVTPEKENIVKRIIEFVDYNTYAVELLGRQLSSSDMSIYDLAAKLSNGLSGLAATEKLRVNKDGRILKKPVIDIIRILFDLANLNDKQKQALRNLYVLRCLNINKQTYLQFNWKQPKNMDVVNDLVEIGWVRKSDKYYSLHPLVEEIVKIDMPPCKDNCEWVFLPMSFHMSQCFESISSDSFASEYAFEKNCMLTCRFLAGLDYGIKSNYELTIDWLLKFFEDLDELETDVPFRCFFDPLSVALERFANSSNADDYQRFDIYFVIFAIWVNEYRRFYIGEAESVKERNAKRKEGLYSSFQHAVDATNSFNEDERNRKLDRLYTFIEEALSALLVSVPKELAEFINNRYKERPYCFVNNPMEEPKETRTHESSNEKVVSLDEETIVVSGYNKASDKVAYVLEIVDNNTLDASEKIKRIDWCLHNLFFELSGFPHRYHFENWNWNAIERIISIRDELVESLSENQYNELYEDDGYNWVSNLVFTCITYAALEKRDSFNLYADLLFRHYPNVEVCVEHPQNIRFQFMHLDMLLDSLVVLSHSSWILYHLIELGHKFESRHKEKGYSDDTGLFSVYDRVQICADAASQEPDISVEERREYDSISDKYLKLKDQSVDVDFSFRT